MTTHGDFTLQGKPTRGKKVAETEMNFTLPTRIDLKIKNVTECYQSLEIAAVSCL